LNTLAFGKSGELTLLLNRPEAQLRGDLPAVEYRCVDPHEFAIVIGRALFTGWPPVSAAVILSEAMAKLLPRIPKLSW
jgi:hypothetical protein